MLQGRLHTLWGDVKGAKEGDTLWQQWLVLPRPKGDGVHERGTCTLASQLQMEPGALELLCARVLGQRVKNGAWEGLGVTGAPRLKGRAMTRTA